MSALTLDDDASLAARSLRGDRAAFSQIVSRYQALVCSIAYSGTGSVALSEDTAQETFVAAWRSLGDLREPERLRPWLCGIARNLTNNARRRAGLDAAPLDDAGELPADGPLPVDEAIRKEEEAVLWRAIEQIPETYRTPLVLFYREGQSVAKVAAELELDEDVVRQRLSRGRRALAAQVLELVEGALERTRPGDDFTRGVMAALPSGGAFVGAASAMKGSALVKSAAGAAAAGLASAGASAFAIWASYRTAVAAARTPEERKLAVRSWREGVLAGIAFTALAVGLQWPRAFWAAHALALSVVASALPAAYAVALVIVIERGVRGSRVLRDMERRRVPRAFERPALEWKSKATLLGLPLWHVRMEPPGVGAPPVVAWIAVGDHAVGVLLALGTVSFGGVSVGAVSAGVLSIGSVAVGVGAVGAVSIGGLSVGTIAAGLVAFGGVAFGWLGAGGAMAFGHRVAGGDLAFAPHANDAAATDFFTRMHAGASVQAMLALAAIFIVVPMAFIAWRIRRRPAIDGSS